MNNLSIAVATDSTFRSILVHKVALNDAILSLGLTFPAADTRMGLSFVTALARIDGLNVQKAAWNDNAYNNNP